MNRILLRLPRFQFFYLSRPLLLALLKLPFANMSQQSAKEKFLTSMRELFGRKHAQITSSYRIALYFTLQSLNLKKDDEVLLSPITIGDTINAICLNGLKPVFIDMDTNNHCLDISKLKEKVTERSKVIVLTYLSGIVPDIDQIKKIANDSNLFLIEDFSQNIDAEYKGRKIGSHGDISLASLSCGKNISSLYGGLILTDKTELNNSINALIESQIELPKKRVLFYYLCNCLKVQVATLRPLFQVLTFPLLQLISFLKQECPADFEQDPIKQNNIFCSASPELRQCFPSDFFVGITDWQFALMSHQIKNLNLNTNKRRKLAMTLIENLSKEAMQFVPNGLLNVKENSYYHFPIGCADNKTAFRKHLFKHGIDNGSYGLNLCSEEKNLPFNTVLPNAHRIKYDSVFLPIHESYDEKHMLHIASVVNDYFSKL